MIVRSKDPLMGRPHLRISDPGLVEYIQMNYRDSCTSVYQGINAVLVNITFNKYRMGSAALVLSWLSLFVDCLDGSGGVTYGGTPPCWRFPGCQCFLGSHSTGIHVDIVPFYHTCSIVHIFFLETSWLLLLLAVSPSALLIARSNYEPRLVHYGFLRLLYWHQRLCQQCRPVSFIYIWSEIFGSPSEAKHGGQWRP